ncbi:MAG: hypothetical protein ACREET_13750 [Stellaceae bacterium]
MQYSETTVISDSAVTGHGTMRWSAIFGGWLLATAMASLMYVAGLAMGLTAIDPYNVEASAKGIATGTAIWVVLTWAVALFLGGMFASWFDGRSDQTVGTLHGVTVWALSISASGLLLAAGLTHVIEGAGMMGSGIAGSGAAATAMAGSPPTSQSRRSGPAADALTGLQAQLTRRVAQSEARTSTPGTGSQATPGQPTSSPGSAAAAAGAEAEDRSSPAAGAGGQVDRQSMAAVAAALLAGRTDNAKSLLAATTGMPQAQVDQTLADVSAQVDKYKADLRAAADAAAHYTAMAMWIAFLTSVIALVAAGVGGWMGAGHIHRVHHARRIESTRLRE